MRKLRKYFFTGIALTLPLIITIYILAALFRFADGLLGRYINLYFKQYFGYTIPGLGLLLFLLIILLTGFFATNYLGKRILHLLERWFLKIPFVSKIYPYIKQFIDMVFAKDKPTFKKVVLIEYPRKGIYSLGFITNEGLKEVEAKINSEIVTVLIPSIPSLYSGYFVFCKKEDVLYLDMTIEQGVKLVISGGILQP
ncbi:MAG: DUF502 domain-containing protein [Candidatus Omnitrophota bacterium]|nr:DUF502 domain-containing protein [Candidatus Omnitrophota bacterium]